MPPPCLGCAPLAAAPLARHLVRQRERLDLLGRRRLLPLFDLVQDLLSQLPAVRAWRRPTTEDAGSRVSGVVASRRCTRRATHHRWPRGSCPHARPACTWAHPMHHPPAPHGIRSRPDAVGPVGGGATVLSRDQAQGALPQVRRRLLDDVAVEDGAVVCLHHRGRKARHRLPVLAQHLGPPTPHGPARRRRPVSTPPVPHPCAAGHGHRTLTLQAGILERAVRPPAIPISLAAMTGPTIVVRFGAMNDIRVST